MVKYSDPSECIWRCKCAPWRRGGTSVLGVSVNIIILLEDVNVVPWRRGGASV